jgi:hypothetical protein
MSSLHNLYLFLATLNFTTMKRQEAVKRIFTKSDDDVLQQSKEQLGSFEKNKRAFIERFSELADPFAEKWSEAISYARSIPPDYASVANQSMQTYALNALIEKGANLYQTLLFYVRLAFPDKSTVLRLFGQNQYDTARRSQLKLPALLMTGYTQASKPEFRTALIAKGMKESEIDGLQSMANNIINLGKAQEKARNDRTLEANKRIIALNIVWEKMALVCHCAKLVFQNDATRYRLFILSNEANPPKNTDETPT